MVRYLKKMKEDLYWTVASCYHLCRISLSSSKIFAITWNEEKKEKHEEPPAGFFSTFLIAISSPRTITSQKAQVQTNLCNKVKRSKSLTFVLQMQLQE